MDSCESVSGVQKSTERERVVNVKRTKQIKEREGTGDEHTGHRKRQRCLNTSEGISKSRRHLLTSTKKEEKKTKTKQKHLKGLTSHTMVMLA